MKKGEKWTKEFRENFIKKRAGHPVSQSTKEKLSKAFKGKPAPWHLGNKYGVGYIPTAEHRKKIAETRLGKKHWNWKGGLPNCKTCNKKLSSRKVAYCRAHCKSGEKSHFWKGGVTSKNMIIRMSAEYSAWRTAVFKRDNYTCIWCGYKGKKLNADHIKPFSLYPELRFSILNGRTLCLNCHKKTDNFGKNLQYLKSS